MKTDLDQGTHDERFADFVGLSTACVVSTGLYLAPGAFRRVRGYLFGGMV
jgi:hypothetical protein